MTHTHEPAVEILGPYAMMHEFLRGVAAAPGIRRVGI